MAISANELRIGNLVWKIVDGGKFVLEIGAENICYIQNESAAEFEPIDITTEMLLKLGFKESSIRKYWHSFRTQNDFYVSICLDNLGGAYVVGEIYAGSSETIVKHIHHLQNLFFCLSGKELTIKSTGFE